MCDMFDFIAGEPPCHKHKIFSLYLFIKDDIKLLQWLRKRDYAGIQYNHNYDDL